MTNRSVPYLLVLIALLACGDAPAQAQQQQIPSSFFGLHVNNSTINGESSYPVQSKVTYGQFRNWDVYQVSWPDIEVCEATTDSPTDACFNPNGNNNWGPR